MTFLRDLLHEWAILPSHYDDTFPGGGGGSPGIWLYRYATNAAGDITSGTPLLWDAPYTGVDDGFTIDGTGHITPPEAGVYQASVYVQAISGDGADWCQLGWGWVDDGWAEKILLPGEESHPLLPFRWAVGDDPFRFTMTVHSGTLSTLTVALSLVKVAELPTGYPPA